MLAVLLAVVSIASHREHTAAIIEKSAANDQWSHYQSSRLKFHNLELGESLIKLMAPKGESTTAALEDYAAQKTKYKEEAKQIQELVKEDAQKADDSEHRALRYDLGEGLLEVGLVLSSIYFISRKKMFPAIGLIAGLTGASIALTGLFMH